jgi:hypothetical protein
MALGPGEFSPSLCLSALFPGSCFPLRAQTLTKGSDAGFRAASHRTACLG